MRVFFGDGIFGHALEERKFHHNRLYFIKWRLLLMEPVSFPSPEDSHIIEMETEYTVTTGISLVTTISPSSGGQNIESVESIRKFAHLRYTLLRTEPSLQTIMRP